MDSIYSNKTFMSSSEEVKFIGNFHKTPVLISSFLFKIVLFSRNVICVITYAFGHFIDICKTKLEFKQVSKNCSIDLMQFLKQKEECCNVPIKKCHIVSIEDELLNFVTEIDFYFPDKERELLFYETVKALDKQFDVSKNCEKLFKGVFDCFQLEIDVRKNKIMAQLEQKMKDACALFKEHLDLQESRSSCPLIQKNQDYLKK